MSPLNPLPLPPRGGSLVGCLVTILVVLTALALTAAVITWSLRYILHG